MVERLFFAYPICENGLAEAAAGEDVLAREPARVVRRKEDRDRGDVAGLAQAAERCLGDRSLFEVTLEEACGLNAFSFHHAGVDGAVRVPGPTRQ